MSPFYTGTKITTLHFNIKVSLMKKILIVSLMMLLTASMAFSQFGINGGINFGTIGGADKTMDAGNNVILILQPKSALQVEYRIGLD